MARQCVRASGRVYKARKNVLLNILRRGLPRAVVEFLERLAEGRRRVEVWICESED
mgnify:CR=1 FL=1